MYAPPQPARRLGPSLVSNHGDTNVFRHGFELLVQFGRRTLKALPVLHELDDGLSHWRTIECRAVLDLDDFIPIGEEQFRTPAHHLVDRCGVLSQSASLGRRDNCKDGLRAIAFAKTSKKVPSNSGRSASKRSHNSSSLLRFASGIRSSSMTNERSSTSPRSVGTLMPLIIGARLSSIITSSSTVYSLRLESASPVTKRQRVSEAESGSAERLSSIGM